MFQIPGSCCTSSHVEEETRDLLTVAGRMEEWLEELSEIDPGNLLLESLLSDWGYVLGLWESRFCPGCDSLKRPAADAPEASPVEELRRVTATLYSIAPRPAPARLDGAPARYTLAPAGRVSVPFLRTPHPGAPGRFTLAGNEGVLLEDCRPLPLPSPLRLRLEEAEDSEECRA